jgi:hypothetical protein
MSLLAASLAAGSAVPAWAQPAGAPTLHLARTATPPEIDGVLDDPAWSDAPVIDQLWQVEPVEGAPPTQRTEVRIVFDDDFMYFGVRCYDDEPNRIIATQLKRDGDQEADDRVEIVIDPYFDRRNGYLFSTNPVGARRDALLEANRLVFENWDGIWYAKSTIDDEGWSTEIAIPFKTISFNPRASRWSFNIERTVRRNNERIRWSSPQQNKQLTSVADAGVLEGIEGITQGVGLDVKPWGKIVYEDEDGRSDDVDFDGGLDAFYKLTPSLTLSLTVNTDFAETEVDERQINLTRFPLFFPEKRDFFLQDEGLFEFGGIRRNPLPFFSRRIGLSPTGQPVDLEAGAKLTGRVGAVNLGALVIAQDDAGPIDSQVVGTVRPKINVLEESTVGLIATTGDTFSNHDNHVVGTDFNYRTSTLFDKAVLEGHAWFLYSSTSGAEGEDESWGFKLRYPNDRVNWSVDVSEIGDRFNAGLGFVPRRGIREYIGRWRYRWRPRDSRIRTIDSGVRGELITDLDDNTETSELSLDLLEIRNDIGDGVSLEIEFDREVLDAPFEIRPGNTIPVGAYDFTRYRGEISSSNARPLSFRAALEGGDFYDGDRLDTEVGAEWRVSPHVFLSFEWEQNDVDLPGGDFQVQVAQARINILPTPDISWTNFIQWDNISDTLGINSRLRWIIEPGSDLYFVVNQGIDTRGDRFNSVLTEVTTKVVWTFRF